MAKNTSDKIKIQSGYDVPFSKAQMINEMAVMSFDIYQLFDKPSKTGEAMETFCENEKDYPRDKNRDDLIKQGKWLYYEDTQPIDMIKEGGYESDEILAMSDFVAEDIEHINDDGTTRFKKSKCDVNAKQRVLFDKAFCDDIEDVYTEVDVDVLFECTCILCPLKIFLNLQECYTVKRKKGEGWFFQFDMRSVANDTSSIKQHIIAHRTAGQIETGVRAIIDGQKTSGIFILKK